MSLYYIPNNTISFFLQICCGKVLTVCQNWVLAANMALLRHKPCDITRDDLKI